MIQVRTSRPVVAGCILLVLASVLAASAAASSAPVPAVAGLPDDSFPTQLGPGVAALAPPTVALNVTPDPAKRYETVTFDASGSSHPDGILRCEFDFDGDGTYDEVSQSCIGFHSYGTLGTYDATVLVVAQSEEFARATEKVRVVARQPPVADFTVSPSDPRPGETVTFDGSPSSDPDGQVMRYQWRVDGQFLAQGRVVQTSLTAGDHQVSLEVMDDDEIRNATTRTVTVRPNAPPVVNVSYTPGFPRAIEVVTFDATASFDPDGQVVEYEWDFTADGTVDLTTTDPVVTHTYPTEDRYVALVRVHDDEGATAGDELVVRVGPPRVPPTARCSVSPTEVEPGGSVTVDATSSENASFARFDLDGDGTYDRSTEGQFLVTTTYETAGTYRPSVTVFGDGLNDTADCGAVTVGGNEPPVASFTVTPANPRVGETVTFDASASFDPDGAIATYRWDFDGDGTVDTVANTPSIDSSYARTGSYVPVLTVRDDEGARGQTTRDLTVRADDRPPVVRCSLSPREVGVDEPVTLDASESDRVAVLRVDVDGDGTVDRRGVESLTPTVTYAERGTYRPRVVAVNEYGTDAADCGEVTVTGNRAPTAALSVSPASVDPGASVTLDASASADPDGRVVEYRWDADGDGSVDRTTAGPTTTWQYPTAGTRTAVVTVVDDEGATDDASDEVRVLEPARPVAVCRLSTPDGEPRESLTVAVGDPVRMDASGSDGATVVGFDVDGDEQVDVTDETDFVSTHRYDAPGTYRVLVRARDGDRTDWATCGEVVVTEPTLTATATETPPPATTERPPTTTSEQEQDPLIPPFDIPRLPPVSVPEVDDLPPGPTAAAGGAIALILLFWVGRRRSYFRPRAPPGRGVERYAAGTVETPAESGRLAVDCGFSPDLVVFAASNDTRGDGGTDRTAGWTYGAAGRDGDGWNQFATSAADDARRVDATTAGFTDAAAFQVVRHGDGGATGAAGGPDGSVGLVRGSLAETTDDGFVLDVDVSGPAGDPVDLATGGTGSAGGVRVSYRAYRFAGDADVAVGHFQTRKKPGKQTVDLGVDADYVELYAGSAVGGPETAATGDRAVGVSVGTAVRPPDAATEGETPDLVPTDHPDAPAQVVYGGTASPARGNETAGTARVGALALLYQEAGEVTGRTTAAVTGLGDRLRLAYDEVYRGSAKVGGKRKGRHPVGYVAVHAGDGRPVLATAPFPADGEDRRIDLGTAPGMVAVGAPGVTDLGDERTDAVATPFGWSEGVAVGGVDAADRDRRQHAVGGGLARVRTPLADGGRAASDGPEQAHAAVARVLTRDAGDVGQADDGGSGVVTGRAEARVTGFTGTGVVLSGRAVGSGERPPAASLLRIVAWPALGRIDGEREERDDEELSP